MSIPRIYLPHSIETGDVCIATAEQGRYLKNVLRMRAGESLRVFTGTGREFEAVIRQTQEGLALEIGEKHSTAADGIEIILCQALPKADRMETIIRHATELGAGRIIPFHAQRSIPRWPEEKSPQKRQRWQKIAVEAARQCGRTDIPEIGQIVSFTEVLRSSPPGWLNLIFWEEESARGIREVLQDPKYEATTGFLLVVGPEGGFDKKEIDQASQAGFLSVSIGKRILRVDTAASAVTAIVQYEKGALGGPQGGGPHGG